MRTTVLYHQHRVFSHHWLHGPTVDVPLLTAIADDAWWMCVRAASPCPSRSLSSFHFSPECYSVRDAKARTCSPRHLGQISSQIAGIEGKRMDCCCWCWRGAVKHLNIVWWKWGSRLTIYISLSILRAFACSSPQPPSSRAMQITRSLFSFVVRPVCFLRTPRRCGNRKRWYAQLPALFYTFGSNLIGDGQLSLLCSDRYSFRELRVGVVGGQGGKKKADFLHFVSSSTGRPGRIRSNNATPPIKRMKKAGSTRGTSLYSIDKL